MRQNPIYNLIQSIEPSDLKVCNRCGCTDLAWIKFKSGKWALVHTTTRRPGYRGEYEAPRGLWAVKTAYHNCAEYTAKKAAEVAQLAQYQAVIDDTKMRAEWCHPKADTPKEILADAVVYLWSNFQEFQDETSAIRQAGNILMEAGKDLVK